MINNGWIQVFFSFREPFLKQGWEGVAQLDTHKTDTESAIEWKDGRLPGNRLWCCFSVRRLIGGWMALVKPEIHPTDHNRKTFWEWIPTAEFDLQSINLSAAISTAFWFIVWKWQFKLNPITLIRRNNNSESEWYFNKTLMITSLYLVVALLVLMSMANKMLSSWSFFNREYAWYLRGINTSLLSVIRVISFYWRKTTSLCRDTPHFCNFKRLYSLWLSILVTDLN